MSYPPRIDSASSAFPPFRIVFEPILNTVSRCISAYEALTRGLDGAVYPQLVRDMSVETRHAFHRAILEETMRSAVRQGFAKLDALLCINIEPEVDTCAFSVEYLRQTALRYEVPVSRIVLEITENHQLSPTQLRHFLDCTKNAGFQTAMDDFGAGCAGLTMLADCNPEVLKLDRALIHGITSSVTRQRIVAALATFCDSLGLTLVAEGVETVDEYETLRSLGIVHMQGFLFCHAQHDFIAFQSHWPSHQQSDSALTIAQSESRFPKPSVAITSSSPMTAMPRSATPSENTRVPLDIVPREPVAHFHAPLRLSGARIVATLADATGVPGN